MGDARQRRDMMTDGGQLNQLIDAALIEDVGLGDVTTKAVVDRERLGTAWVITREETVVAGLEVFERVFHRLDQSVKITPRSEDGSWLATNERLVELAGPLTSILTAERVALNFLQRLCGIATLTRRYVDAVPEGCTTVIVDTRKTTPSLRALERYAVRCGGGSNHRPRLDGGLLIKDNHIAACGSVTEAIARTRATQGPALRIEVEVTTLDELEEALSARAEVVMLDNMDLETTRQAMKLVRGHALVEASGGITLEEVEPRARLGVDFISVGALTHSAPAVDLTLKVESS